MKSGELWECIHDGNIWEIVKLARRIADDSGNYCSEAVILRLIKISEDPKRTKEQDLLRAIFGEPDVKVGYESYMSRKDLIENFRKIYD